MSLLVCLLVAAAAAVNVRSVGGRNTLKMRVPTAWAYADSGYSQLSSTRFQNAGLKPVDAWPTLPFSNTTQVADTLRSDGSFFVLTLSQLFACAFPEYPANDTGLPPLPLACSSVQTPSLGAGSRLFVRDASLFGVVTPTGYATCSANSCSGLVAFAFGAVGAATADGVDAWIGAQNGVFRLHLAKSPYRLEPLNVPLVGSGCTAVSAASSTHNALATTSTIAFGFNCSTSNVGLLVRALVNLSAPATPVRWSHWFTPGVIDESPYGLSFADDGQLWIADDVVHAQANVDASLRIRRFGPQERLPRNSCRHITTTSTGGVWVGTDRGVLRYGARPNSKESFKWKALMGGRWLPGRLAGTPAQASFYDGQRVQSIAALRFNSGMMGPHRKPLVEAVVVATDNGLAVITYETWTLKDKADYIEAKVKPRHDRFGYVTSCGLSDYANVSSWYGTPTDNDGLANGGYVSAQAYRFAATGSQDAHDRGMEAFYALKQLIDVAYPTGFVARAVVKILNIRQGGVWYQSKSLPQWIFKGDTSSDETTGHLGTYAMVYDLLATNAKERDDAAAAQQTLTAWIAKNNYTLIGPDGPTRWGQWSPAELNDDPKWEDERGLNSGELLAYLTAASRVTKNDTYFLPQVLRLIAKHGYAENLNNFYIQNPLDNAYFDDYLGWFALRILLYYLYGTGVPTFDANFDLAMVQWYELGRYTNAPLDAYLYGLWHLASNSTAEKPGLHGAIETLMDMQIDLINYTSDQSDRWDVEFDPQTQYLLKPVAYDEATLDEFNRNPFIPVTPGYNTGFNEGRPQSFLMAYWMGRYHGYIV